MKLDLNFEKTLRSVSVTFMETEIPFNLNLTSQDLDRILSYCASYRAVEATAQGWLAKFVTAETSDILAVARITDKMEAIFNVRDQVVGVVKELLDEKKITLATKVKDKTGAVLTSDILCANPLFNSFLYDIAESILFWDKSSAEIKKKRSWLSLFARIFQRGKLR